MNEERVSAANSWCHTARPYRLLTLDGRALIPFMLWLVHISWPTFYVAASAAIVFGTLEYAQLPLPMAWRRLRCLLAGRVRPARRPRRLFS